MRYPPRTLRAVAELLGLVFAATVVGSAAVVLATFVGATLAAW